jgi:hypothetical protein
LKSRFCEKCKNTNERGTFIGINYFAFGGLKWDTSLSSDDELGCVGCFWYDTSFWRNSLNKKINK